ncbi:hypothetical protein Vadar_006096 [Vaccinium darrowii]|uniref:Uncharacterized protein n=1 Tax=Vaccinium darrowii TaxID=229202 RepID=A0ACB7Z1Q6_9ERIC|nr:hypothetical protein Vadar_006096 [Vaccinium darrowii]
MEISTSLVKFKFHILFAAAFSLLVFSLICVAPRFLDVLAYFWPLLVSTALFLLAVVLIARTSPPATEAPAEKTAEGILEFVAAQPDAVVLQPAEECSTSDRTM